MKKIINGDCLKVMQEMDDNSVELSYESGDRESRRLSQPETVEDALLFIASACGAEGFSTLLHLHYLAQGKKAVSVSFPALAESVFGKKSDAKERLMGVLNSLHHSQFRIQAGDEWRLISPLRITGGITPEGQEYPKQLDFVLSIGIESGFFFLPAAALNLRKDRKIKNVFG